MHMHWDAETKRFQDHRFILEIQTGTSMKLHNRFTRLGLQHPIETKAIYDNLLAVITDLSQTVTDSSDHPNVPQIVRFSRRTSWGRFVAYIVWGVVLTGAKQKSARLGFYRFVIVAGGELPDCLSTVFNLEYTLEVTKQAS